MIELRQEKEETLTAMRGMLDKADEEKRGLSADEQSAYDVLDAKLESILKRIQAEDKIAGLEAQRNDVVNPFKGVAIHAVKKEYDADKEFKNLGEFADCIANRPTDRRLLEIREQQMGTGTTGGFAIPEQWKAEIWGIAPQVGIVRPRATVIPAGSPPDAKLTMPAIDQTSGANMYGGVTLVHTGEGVTITETTAKLREISWEPKEISGFIVATNKLLTNWDAATAFLTTQLRGAMVAAEDYDFLRGDGVNRALGIINNPAAIVYGRAGASAIAFADIYGMLARLKMGGSPVWIASQTVIPQLAAMVDAGSHSVWLGGALMGSAKEGMPSSLFGIPIVFSDRLPTLGTKGDLILADMSYYIIKDGSGPFLSWTEHVYWTANKSAVKIVWNVDGKAWLTEPLILEGTTASTVSPFVVLS
jgi:HK97 family phage major capsid protein